MLSADQRTLDTQTLSVGAHLDPGHLVRDTQSRHVGVSSCSDHWPGDTQRNAVAAHLDPGQTWPDTHPSRAGAPTCSDHDDSDTHDGAVAAPHDALLLILADALDDLERVRIATDNRIRSLEQVKGLADSPERDRLIELRTGIAALEHRAQLDLERAMKAHPLGPWVKRTHGVGEKQAARLLAAIGDPAERPNPAKLWQYAGHGDPARSHLRKGQPVEHSPIAKMRTRMVADKAVQAGVRKLDGWDDSEGYDFAHRTAISPLGQVYLRERAKWASRDTTDGHRHNHALRVVGKAMLLDLWREARHLRGDQLEDDTHDLLVPADLRGDRNPDDTHDTVVPASLPPTILVATPNGRSSAAHSLTGEIA